MNQRPRNDGQPWTRDELVLAFDLYCRIPFQKTKASNPHVKQLASLLQRTPAAVARKLGNFGAFDPALKKRNISGLAHGSRLDREVWDEFHKDWARLVVQAYTLREQFPSSAEEDILSTSLPSGPSERTRPAKQRLHQAFFRETVLSSYNCTCCVTGLPFPECLVASHIVPWSKDEGLRADPHNGLCLSATFDRLFDTGLVTISEEMTLIVSTRIRRSTNAAARREIAERHDQPIIPPVRFHPSQENLKWHRQNVFLE